MVLSERQAKLCDESRWGFSDLRATYLNCTLNRSPERSHTQGLMDRSMAILEKNGVAVEVLHGAGELNLVGAPVVNGDLVAPGQQAVHDEGAGGPGTADDQSLHTCTSCPHCAFLVRICLSPG